MKEALEKIYWDTVNNAGEIKRNPDHPVVQYFSKQRLDYLFQFINSKSITNALDVGCGTGFSSHYVPQNISLTSVDFSSRLLKLNPSQNKIQTSAYSLPFDSECFDLVYGWDFLHHLDSPKKAIEEMFRVAKKYVVFFEPNKNNLIQFLYAYSNKNERGTLNYDKKNMLKLVNDLDCNVISCENIGWIFAGATPLFTLPFFKKMRFKHRLGISVVLICQKK